MSEPDISSVINSLPEFFQPETAVGVKAKIGFDISGEQGGQWAVDIQNQTCQVTSGLPEHADLTLSADGQDLIDIFSGKLSPMRAFFIGKLKLQGNMSQAMKISDYFKMDSEKLNRLGIHLD